MEFQVLFHRVDMIEDIVNYPGYDALFLWIADNALHGMRFTGGRLSVGEYGTVITCEDIRYDAFRRFIVYFLLSRVWFEDFVK